SQCASIVSKPLLNRVAESIVIFGPMLHVGCFHAFSGVPESKSRRGFPRTGPPGAGSRTPLTPEAYTAAPASVTRSSGAPQPAPPQNIRCLYASARRRISIFVSSTRQRKGARVSFAAAASFSALLFAASPSISIRSGISRATLSALSPIEPVAPRITTRLRFIFRQNEQNLPNGLKRYRLRFWNTKFFLKFQ